MESIDLADMRMAGDHFELEALARAENYQRWIFRAVEPYLGSRILELGAGIGNMSKWLPLRDRLVLSEADPELLNELQTEMTLRHGSDTRVRVARMDLSSDDWSTEFEEDLDTIVSFNVLEHVEDDLGAVARLGGLLRRSRAPGPRRLVSFVPAHPWAYGSMDRTFGHFRRYSAGGFAKLAREAAPDARLTFRHFNAVGLVGWLLQGRLLRKKNIGLGSIRAFERICPYVGPVDDFLHGTFKLPVGQSLLAVLEWN